MEEKSDNIGVAVVAGIELAKLALQLYFRAMEMAGKTAEEIEILYQSERAYFMVNTPATLPDMEEDNG